MKSKEPKIIHTYMSDMANVIRENKENVIKIALAEKEKLEREEELKRAEGTKTQKKFWMIGGIILLIISTAGIYFVHIKKTIRENIIPQTEKIETFINYEDYSSINISEFKSTESFIEKIISEIKNISTDKHIKSIFVKKNVIEIDKKGNEIKTEKLVGSREFLSFWGGNKPSTFLFSLKDEFLLGSYANGDKIGTFLIFETNDYNTTYSKILEWEETMATDLKQLFNIKRDMGSDIVFSKEFVDLVINNKYVRVLYNENGEEVLLYSFIDKNKLLITDDKILFQEIINRNVIKSLKSKE